MELKRRWLRSPDRWRSYPSSLPKLAVRLLLFFLQSFLVQPALGKKEWPSVQFIIAWSSAHCKVSKHHSLLFQFESQDLTLSVFLYSTIRGFFLLNEDNWRYQKFPDYDAHLPSLFGERLDDRGGTSEWKKWAPQWFDRMQRGSPPHYHQWPSEARDPRCSRLRPASPEYPWASFRSGPSLSLSQSDVPLSGTCS